MSFRIAAYLNRLRNFKNYYFKSRSKVSLKALKNYFQNSKNESNNFNYILFLN